MTPEDRARAVVGHFPEVPAGMHAELQDVITRAIKRALNEQLSKLEIEADRAMTRARGQGKSAKGYDPQSFYVHREWRSRFHFMRTGHWPEDNRFDLLKAPRC